MAEAKKEKEFSTYKGRPLVRCGDEIYYGNMEEPYVIRMQIKSKKEQTAYGYRPVPLTAQAAC